MADEQAAFQRFPRGKTVLVHGYQRRVVGCYARPDSRVYVELDRPVLGTRTWPVGEVRAVDNLTGD